MIRLRFSPSLFAACLLALFFPASVEAAEHGYDKLEDCRLMPNASNDGDSFHVKADGKEFIFRIYFVDAPETSLEFPERVDEQAKYFGISAKEAVRIGKVAEDFTRSKLAKPFTVYTRWQDARGESRLPRYYAHVMVDDKTLGELLVANGLGRVFGMPAVMPNGMSAKAFDAHLKTLEAKAKSDHLGAWSVNAAAPQKNDWSNFFPAHPAASASPGLK